MGTRSKKAHPAEDVGIFWLSCDGCQRWELFENTGLPGPYDEMKVKKAKFTCQFCIITGKLEAALSEIGSLSNKIVKLETGIAANKENEKKWSDIVRGVPADLKANQDRAQAEFGNFKKELLQMVEEKK